MADIIVKLIKAALGALIGAIEASIYFIVMNYLFGMPVNDYVFTGVVAGAIFASISTIKVTEVLGEGEEY